MLPAVYASATTAALAALIAARYGLPEPITCTLLRRGFNDTYAVDTADGRYVFRVCGAGRRSLADATAETQFLAYLDQAGVPVAAAIPDWDGKLVLPVGLPQGERAGVLFRHAGGRPPGLDSPIDAALQGATLARLHNAADRFPDRESGQHRLNLDALLHRPLDAVRALNLDAPETWRRLNAMERWLADRIGPWPGLSLTRCHGDCHGLNAHIVSGDAGAQAVLFDFDDGGYGYLAYDLAVHLWAQISFGRRRHAIWHAFIDGYRGVRAITAADYEAAQFFVPVRHIWVLGAFAERTAEWGSQVVGTEFLTQAETFLSDWKDRVLTGLPLMPG